MTTLNPLETALIVTLLQGDIVNAGTAFGGLFNPEVVRLNVIAQCNDAMEIVRGAGGLVIPTRVAFEPGHSDLNLPASLRALISRLR